MRKVILSLFLVLLIVLGAVFFWRYKTVKVTFDLNASDADDTQVVRIKKGKQVQEPTPPERDEFRFDGWFLDADTTIPFNFEERVTRNITLYAAWSAFAEVMAYAKPVEEEYVAEGWFQDDGADVLRQYINNQALVFAERGVTRTQIEDLAASCGASVVGIIEEIGHYQLEFDSPRTLAELIGLVEWLEETPLIKFASLNMVSDIGTVAVLSPYYPDDSWNIQSSALHVFGNEPRGDVWRWNEGYPDGNNWGVEAIHAPSAWRLLKENRRNIPSVKVGVIDTMFDQEHSELTFANVWDFNGDKLPANQTRELAANAETTEAYHDFIHGTHVAGTIAAAMNNKGKGINGVAINPRLYGVSLMDSERVLHTQVKFNQFPLKSIFTLETAVARLLLADEKSNTIINYSMRDGLTGWYARQDMTLFLEAFRELGYEFLIVSAAGNAFDRDASVMSCFNSIRSKEIRDRILVVSEVELGIDVFSACTQGTNEETKELSYMCYGPRIDISAPGMSIYSTVPPHDGWAEDTEYFRASGTSMATPHVAGTAALVWAANPSITGADVKRIIVESADYTVTGNIIEAGDNGLVRIYPDKMLNAARAVANVLNLPYELGGVCGKSLTWKIDTDTWTLTISGKGDMYNYETVSYRPWYRYRNQVCALVVEDGVTSIGNLAFEDFPELRRLELGNTLSEIREGAFLNCVNLSEISDIPETLKEIGPSAFYKTALKETSFLGEARNHLAIDANEGENASFPADILLWYLPQFQKSWDEDGDGLWKGYNVKPLGAVGADYDSFIRDTLIPQYGLADTETKKKVISAADYHAGKAPLYWDKRKGLLSATVTDLNQDGADDLLVLFFDVDTSEETQPYGQYQETLALYAAVFTMNSSGAIVPVGTQRVGGTTAAESYRLAAMLATIDGKPVLLVEESARGVFVDYGIPAFYAYSYQPDNAWGLRYKMEQSHGGTSDTAYSLWDYEKPDNPRETILYGDYEYRYTHPDVTLPLPVSSGIADIADYGFSKIGLSLSLGKDSDFYGEPTAWDASEITRLLLYRVKSDGYAPAQFTSSLTDCTGLRGGTSDGQENAEPVNETSNAAAEAFKTFLRSYSATNDSRFAVVYIDEDDVPELLVFNGMAHVSKAELYVFKDGQVVLTGEFGTYGTFAYTPRKNWFVNYVVSNRSGEYTDYCRLTADGYEKVNSLFMAYEEPPRFKVDGTEVTEEEFDRKLRELAGNDEIVLTGNRDGYRLNEDSYASAFPD